MIDLYDFLFKYVILVDKYGDKHRGYVDFYESKYDNDSDESSIGLIPDKNAKSGWEYYESDIQSIVIDEEREKSKQNQ